MTEEIKDGGNGKLAPEPAKTEEQLSQERKERFAKDPDSFIECSEIVCGALRNPGSSVGVSIVIGVAKRTEMDIAQAELNRRIDSVCRQMDAQAEMERKGKIQPVKGSMFDFARRKR